MPDVRSQVAAFIFYSLWRQLFRYSVAASQKQQRRPKQPKKEKHLSDILVHVDLMMLSAAVVKVIVRLTLYAVNIAAPGEEVFESVVAII